MNAMHENNAPPLSNAYIVEGCEGPYTDYVQVSVREIKSQMDAPESKRKGPRGGVSEPFPVKLYEMLAGVERERREHIVSWAKHGRCFIIHHAQSFVDDIMPVYFKQSKLTSFQRQLNLYGFQRVSCHQDRGGYYHPLFLRGRPDICKILLRQRVKGGAALRSPIEASTKTSLYALPHCPPAMQGNFGLVEDDSEGYDDDPLAKRSASHSLYTYGDKVPSGNSKNVYDRSYHLNEPSSMYQQNQQSALRGFGRQDNRYGTAHPHDMLHETRGSGRPGFPQLPNGQPQREGMRYHPEARDRSNRESVYSQQHYTSPYPIDNKLDTSYTGSGLAHRQSHSRVHDVSRNYRNQGFFPPHTGSRNLRREPSYPHNTMSGEEANMADLFAGQTYQSVYDESLHDSVNTFDATMDDR